MHRSWKPLVFAIAIVGAFVAGKLSAGWPPLGQVNAQNAAEAVDRAFSRGSRLERMTELSRALGHLSPENVDAILAQYLQVLPVAGECDIRPFMDGWTRFDGRAAFMEALSWRQHPVKMSVAVEAAAHGWTLQNVSEALPVIEATAQERPRLAQKLRSALVSAWVHSGAAGLDTYLREGPGDPDRILTVAVAARLRRDGLDGLAEWADAFVASSSNELARKAFRKTAHQLAARDPEYAAHWVSAERGESWVTEGAQVVAETWVQKEPDAALEWIRTALPAPVRDEATSLAFGRWLHADRAAAIAWLESSEDPQMRAPAIHVLARQWAPNRPHEAIEWCEQIGDEARRNDCLAVAARRWYRRAPHEAGQWLAESPLDEATRNAIRALDEVPRQLGSRPARGAGR